MAIVKPFKAVRPQVKYVKDVASLPYDVYSKKEAREAVKNRPLAFLNIDRPETMFDEDYNMYDQSVYNKAKEVLYKQIKEGIYTQDDKDYYYIYELTMNNHSQSGIVALSSIDDYLNDVCKKHENTVEEKEIDRINHVDTLSAQTGPIFLAYRHKDEIKEIINNTKKDEPLYDFTSEDNIIHRVWIIKETTKLEQLFNEVDHTYIADGHHRCASAVKVGLKRRKENPNYSGDEEFNYFLSVLFADDELDIWDYNRFVKDLNNLSKEELFKKLENVFEIDESIKEKPKHKGEIKMYLDKKWYLLKVKEEIKKERVSPVTSLDVSILQDEVLTKIFDIDDPRTNKRIAFVGGIRGLDELEKLVDETVDSVSFAMYPTSINELLNVADASLLMPPKSTWFEPKLRSGLFIHLF